MRHIVSTYMRPTASIRPLCIVRSCFLLIIINNFVGALAVFLFAMMLVSEGL